jgi:Tfp pilus assembly protein PilF
MSHNATSSATWTAVLPSAAMAVLALALAGCGSNGSIGTDPTADENADWRAELTLSRSNALAEPEVAYWPYREAQLLVSQDSLASAERALHRVLAFEATHAPSLALISKLDYDAGRHDVAIARLEAVSTEGPLPTELQLALGLHFEAAGNFAASDSIFDSVHSDHNSLAYYALRSDNLERAKEVAAQSLRAHPESAAANNDYGITQLYSGKPKAAREHFLSALTLDAQHLGALYNLAIVEAFYFLDDEEGEDWFRQYRELGGIEDPDRLGEHFDTLRADSVGKQARR